MKTMKLVWGYPTKKAYVRYTRTRLCCAGATYPEVKDSLCGKCNHKFNRKWKDDDFED